MQENISRPNNTICTKFIEPCFTTPKATYADPLGVKDFET